MTAAAYTAEMRTVVPPDQIAERRRLGLDRFDEVWEGEYRMSAAPHPRHSFILRHVLRHLDPITEAIGLVPLGEFNLGRRDDFRIPDAGYVDALPADVFTASARIVIEVVSPRDATFEKLPFYARHRVDEVLIVDPVARTARWLTLDLQSSEYLGSLESKLLHVTGASIAANLPWEQLDS